MYEIVKGAEAHRCSLVLIGLMESFQKLLLQNATNRLLLCIMNRKRSSNSVYPLQCTVKIFLSQKLYEITYRCSSICPEFDRKHQHSVSLYIFTVPFFSKFATSTVLFFMTLLPCLVIRMNHA